MAGNSRTASFTALTAVFAVVATVLMVTGGLFTASGATSDSHRKCTKQIVHVSRGKIAETHRKCRKPVAHATKTVTATTTLTVPGPTQTVTATATVPGPTATATVTATATADRNCHGGSDQRLPVRCLSSAPSPATCPPPTTASPTRRGWAGSPRSSVARSASRGSTRVET